jgi:hypothetical protein
MIHASNTNETLINKPILPAWIMHTSVPESIETAGFASGSALALLHGICCKVSLFWCSEQTVLSASL